MVPACMLYHPANEAQPRLYVCPQLPRLYKHLQTYSLNFYLEQNYENPFKEKEKESKEEAKR